METKSEVEILANVIRSIEYLERNANAEVSYRIGSTNPEKRNGLENRGDHIETFLEFRKLVKEEKNSYKQAVNIIKKYTNAETRKKLDKTVQELYVIWYASNSSEGRLHYGHEEIVLANIEALEELESRFFPHTDGKKSKFNHVPRDKSFEAILTTQFVFAVQESLPLLQMLKMESKQTIKSIRLATQLQ